MASSTLEQRVADLEKLVEELRQRSDVSANPKDWRRTIGMFDDDAIMKEIIEESQRVREEDRKQSDS